MVRIRLEKPWALYDGRISQRKDGKIYIHYSEHKFYDQLHDNGWEKDFEHRFRDEYSRKLIKEMEQAELVETDRYSLLTPGGRICFSALQEDTKYGLTVIRNSFKGAYVVYREVNRKIWKILSQLPMDIWIVVSVDTCVDSQMVEAMQPMVIENYRYDGREVECIVDEKCEECFCSGKNRLYRKKLTLKYDWMKYADILPVYLKYISEDTRLNLIPLTSRYTLQEFFKVLHAELPSEIADVKLQVINHLRYKPDNIIYGHCPYLMVAQGEKGDYYILEDMSLGKSSFEDTFGQISISVRDKYLVKMILVLEINGRPQSMDDIKKVYYGAKITKDAIELFDQTKALIVFREMLTEAITSENCVMKSEDEM